MKKLFMFLVVTVSVAATSCTTDFDAMESQVEEKVSGTGGGEDDPCKGDCPIGEE